VIVEFGNKFSEFAKQPFVIDNANVTRSEHARYIAPAKAARFRVVGCPFNGRQLIPKKGIANTYKRLQLY
jgi:hypothetical protein